jgi:hypothetical protein
MKTRLLALALFLAPLMACATPPAPAEPARAAAASAPASAASAACPARSAPTRITSKARHTIDDGDPCADPHSPPVRR